MEKKALKDLPLQEVTLRKYEEPKNLGQRELVKKFLLSIGLLNPGDSRDVIVDLFLLLLSARSSKKTLSIEDIVQNLSSIKGASKPNLRRQLRRLKEYKLVEKTLDGYRISEFGQIKSIIDAYLKEYLIKPTLDRIAQYAEKLDSDFTKSAEENQNQQTNNQN
jgi:DNA-binding transcriptional ArsR family regulator